jgi:hypothetical protein
MNSSAEPVPSEPFGIVEADPRARKSARLSGNLLAASALEFSGAAKDGARQAAASKTAENSLKNERRKLNLKNTLDSIA